MKFKLMKDPPKIRILMSYLKTAFIYGIFSIMIGTGISTITPITAYAYASFKSQDGKTTYNSKYTGYRNGGAQHSVTVPCGTVVKYSGPNLGYDGANPRTLYHTESGVVLHHHTEGYDDDDSREDFYHTVTINATWGNWVRTTNPTCTRQGVDTRTCSGCGATETRSVAALGHAYSTTWSSNSTQHWKACTRSGCTSKANIANHTFSNYYDDTATCTATGTRKRKCSTCGYVETSTSPAKGHVSPSDYTISNGYKIKNCTRCGQELEKIAVTYNIAFDSNGATSGSMETQTVQFDTNTKLAKNQFKKDRFAFIGWSLDKNSIDNLYTDEQTIKNLTTNAGATVTLYAQWKHAYTVNVRYENPDGTFGDYIAETQYLDEGDKFTWTCQKAHDNPVQWQPVEDINETVGDDNKTWNIDVKLQEVYLGINGYVDGHILPNGDLGNIGTVDVYVNGEQVATDVDDWCEKVKYGSTYEIKNVKSSLKYTLDHISPGASGVVNTFTDSLDGIKKMYLGIYFTTKQESATLKSGPEINEAFKQLAGNLEYIRHIHQAPEIPGNVSTSSINIASDGTVQAWFAGESIFLYTPATHVHFASNSSQLLAGMTNLEDIGPLAKWDMSDATTLEGFFKDDAALTTLNLTAWITKNVSNITDFCNGCSSLTAIYADSNNWVMSNVGDYKKGVNVFAGCSKLDNFDASVVDVTKANTNGYLTESESTVDWNVPIKTMQDMANNREDQLLTNVYSKEGYRFGGWSLTPNGPIKYDNGATVTNLTYDTDGVAQLFAVWVQNTYSLAFDKNDEKATGTMASQIFRVDEPQAINSISYLKTGYHLDKWATNTDGTGNTYQDQQVVTNLTTINNKVIKLYAQWQPNDYTVHYNSNWSKATGNMKDQKFTYDKAQKLTANGFRRTGYWFAGWNREEDLSGEQFDDKQEVINLTAERDGIVNLYADWKANNYTIKFDKNLTDDVPIDGAMEDLSCVYDQDYVLPTNTFKKTGNLFTGWNTEADGSGTSYTDGQTVKNLTTTKDGIVTLYAQWDPASYIIQYSGNGSTSGTMPTQMMTYGKAVNLIENKYERIGYTFKHWNMTLNNQTSTYEDKALVQNLTTERGRVLTFMAQWEANAYTVVFDKNAAKATGTMSSQAFTYDTPQNLTANAYQYTGYIFSGWNTKTDGTGTDYTDEDEVLNLTPDVGGVVTLYAKWTPITYKIAFESNTGTGSMVEITATYDHELTLPANTFKKTGYPFAGWNTNSDGTGASYVDQASVVNLTDKQDTTITLYAQWSASVYYIRFHGGDGATGTMSDQPITYDIKQQLNPNTFSKTGYTFANWSLTEDGKGTSYQDKEEILNLTDENNAIIHMYAQWNANKYTVEFEKNSANVTGTMKNQEFTFDQAQKLTKNTYVKTGYTFTGWNTQADGKGITYTNEQQVKNLTATLNGTVTLYAQWKANAYTVEYLPNGENTTGTMNPQPYTYDQLQPLRANAFVKTGYLFDHWSTKADGSGINYSDQENVKNLTANPYGIVQLFAQWTPITYHVKFDANSEYASGSMNIQDFTYDEPKKLTALGYSYTGYLFNGWNTEPDGSGTSYHDEQEVQNLSNVNGSTITLYAQWQGNAYYVDFDGNGADSGSMGKQALVYDKGMAIAPNAFKKEGYHFVHWTLHEDGTGLIVLDEEVVVNLTDENGGTAVLYAQWEPNSYTVAYNKNAGDAKGNMEATTFTYNQKGYLVENQYSRTGYTFTGWNTKKDGSGTAYNDMAEVENLTSDENGTVTLYAQWKASTYKIVYDKNNANAKGSIPDTKATYDVALIIGKCSYTLDGYTFTEWNTKPDGTGTSYPAGMEVTNLCDKNGDKIILYAQWTANTYSITYNKNSSKATGAMASQIFRYDTAMKLSKNTYSYTGYLFDGWNTQSDGSGTAYADEQEVNNITSSNKATIVLYAQWQPITYTVHFHSGADDASGSMANQTFTYDQATTLMLNTFEKIGYQFAGWATQEGNSTIAYTDGEAVKNLANTDQATVDLYAVWGGITYYVAFDGNESTSGSMSDITLNYDAVQTLPKSTFARYGYQFSGWNTKADGTGAGYRDQGDVLNLTTNANETITLYAQWKANKYTINFDKNATDATGTMDLQEVAFGEETPLNANQFVRTGYMFAGWNLRANGTGNAYTDKQPILNLVMVDGGEITLYAQWTPITYTVSFDSGAFNTTGTMEPQTFAYNQTAALNANQFVRDGYLFEGWSTERNDESVMYRDKASVTNLADTQDANVTLYAKWSHSKYYVSFHGNGHTSGTMATQEFVYGESQDLTKNGFIKTGWNFIGWNTEADGTGDSYADEETFTNPVVTAGGTIDLYAQWENTSSTVSYVLNGGEWAAGYTAPTSHMYDEELVLPTAANVKRTGFIFLGWYENSGFSGTCYTKLPANTGDKTLYAAWYDMNGKKNGISKPIKNEYQYGN